MKDHNPATSQEGDRFLLEGELAEIRQVITGRERDMAVRQAAGRDLSERERRGLDRLRATEQRLKRLLDQAAADADARKQAARDQRTADRQEVQP